ncbi:MAG: acyl-ACP--UDP-N-acetylglucosamine O-acyltransferase [bacterium]
MDINKSAEVDPKAELGNGVKIGPFTVVEGDVEIGVGTEVHPNVVIRKGTRIGENCRIYSGAVLGGEPQDTKFKGEESFLTIGNGTIIRECVTAHRGSGEQTATKIGSGCMLMVSTHVAHNCVVGDRVTMANLATLGGFSQVGDGAFVGGLAGLHQFVRVGAYVMVGGGSVLMEDVPPYMMVTGGCRPPVCGLNRIGIMRAGFSSEARSALHKAYRILYKQGRTIEDAVSIMKEQLSEFEEVRVLIDFLDKKSDRGISAGR